MAGSRRNTLWMRDLYEGSLAKNRLPQLFLGLCTRNLNQKFCTLART